MYNNIPYRNPQKCKCERNIILQKPQRHPFSPCKLRACFEKAATRRWKQEFFFLKHSTMFSRFASVNLYEVQVTTMEFKPNFVFILVCVFRTILLKNIHDVFSQKKLNVKKRIIGFPKYNICIIYYYELIVCTMD